MFEQGDVPRVADTDNHDEAGSVKQSKRQHTPSIIAAAPDEASLAGRSENPRCQAGESVQQANVRRDDAHDKALNASYARRHADHEACGRH